jgi:hypothetical protein
MRKSYKFWSFLGLFVLLSTKSFAGPPAQIDQLHWLTGNWIGKIRSDEIEENWLAPEGGSIIAMVRIRSSADSTSEYEVVLIEEEGDTLVLSVNQFGRGLVFDRDVPQKMELVEITDNSVSFRDPERNGFASIRYTRVDEENFQIYVVRADGSIADIPMKARSLWK